MGKRARQERRQAGDRRQVDRGPRGGGSAALNDQGRPAAAGRTERAILVAPGYPDEWRLRVHNEQERIRRSRRELEQLIGGAIAAGATWSGIATALGCSRQWARKKYGHLRPTVDLSLPASAGS